MQTLSQITYDIGLAQSKCERRSIAPVRSVVAKSTQLVYNISFITRLVRTCLWRTRIHVVVYFVNIQNACTKLTVWCTLTRSIYMYIGTAMQQMRSRPCLPMLYIPIHVSYLVNCPNTLFTPCIRTNHRFGYIYTLDHTSNATLF